jgi:biofilm protein TabA
MIFDYISKWPLYFSAHVFKNIFGKLDQLLVETPPCGEYPLDDYDVFFKVLSYETKSADWITESHRKYVDIQIVTEGSESIRLYEREKLEVQIAYNDDNDCEFYKLPDSSVVNNSVTLRPGHMGIFFPQDVHTTQIAPVQTQTIKKVVIKVNEKYFT